MQLFITSYEWKVLADNEDPSLLKFIGLVDAKSLISQVYDKKYELARIIPFESNSSTHYMSHSHL
jgi:hypothetical protein